MRILYIISSLGIGGAEKQLCNLSDNLFLYKKHKVNIIVLNNNIQTKPKNKNIKIFSLNITKNPISFLIGLNKLINLIKKIKPDLIHAHLFHAIIISRITKILFRKIPLICTLHNSIYKISLRSKLLKYSSFLSDLNTAVSRSALESYLYEKTGMYIDKDQIKNLPEIDTLIDIGVGDEGTPDLYENIKMDSGS